MVNVCLGQKRTEDAPWVLVFGPPDDSIGLYGASPLGKVLTKAGQSQVPLLSDWELVRRRGCMNCKCPEIHQKHLSHATNSSVRGSPPRRA